MCGGLLFKNLKFGVVVVLAFSNFNTKPSCFFTLLSGWFGFLFSIPVRWPVV